MAGLVWLVMAVPARGGTAVQVLEAFGLFGTWSPDCAQPPSVANPRVTYELFGDAIIHTVTFDGRTLAIRDTITAAMLLGPGSLHIAIERDAGFAWMVTIESVGGRIHATRSVGPDGRVYYDDGIELATGKPSLTDERCQADMS